MNFCFNKIPVIKRNVFYSLYNSVSFDFCTTKTTKLNSMQSSWSWAIRTIIKVIFGPTFRFHLIKNLLTLEQTSGRLGEWFCLSSFTMLRKVFLFKKFSSQSFTHLYKNSCHKAENNDESPTLLCMLQITCLKSNPTKQLIFTPPYHSNF